MAEPDPEVYITVEQVREIAHSHPHLFDRVLADPTPTPRPRFARGGIVNPPQEAPDGR